MSSSIEITISPTGDTKVEVINGSGPDCSNLTKAIEASVGKTVSDVKKPEFTQQHDQGQQQKAGW